MKRSASEFRTPGANNKWCRIIQLKPAKLSFKVEVQVLWMLLPIKHFFSNSMVLQKSLTCERCAQYRYWKMNINSSASIQRNEILWKSNFQFGIALFSNRRCWVFFWPPALCKLMRTYANGEEKPQIIAHHILSVWCLAYHLFKVFNKMTINWRMVTKPDILMRATKKKQQKMEIDHIQNNNFVFGNGSAGKNASHNNSWWFICVSNDVRVALYTMHTKLNHLKSMTWNVNLLTNELLRSINNEQWFDHKLDRNLW